MASYLLLKAARKLPGIVIKTIPKPKPVLTEGFGTREKAAEICKDAGYGKVLIVTDKTLFSLGFHEAIAAALSDRGIGYTVFSDIASEPNVAIIEKGIDAALSSGAECLIALGGGSVMDSGKIIAAGAKLNERKAARLLKKFRTVRGGTLPMITIPSTAGTGAEFTVGAVVTNAKGTKCSTVISGLNVTNVILDSELTVNAPRNVTAGCGIDALSHGLEGCVASVKTDKETERKSMECVKLVLENLPIVLDDPHNKEARQNMCRAAFYGGNSINEQLAGYVHAFAHSIGAVYHIPHGTAIALSLLPVMDFQKEKCAKKLAALAGYCGLAGEGDTDIDAAGRLLAKIAELINECGFTGADKIDANDYKELKKRISDDAINYSAPVVMKKSDIALVLDRIREK